LCELPHAVSASADSKISDRDQFQRLFQAFSPSGVASPKPKLWLPGTKTSSTTIDHGEFPKFKHQMPYA
jgi:hypothetical protein